MTVDQAVSPFVTDRGTRGMESIDRGKAILSEMQRIDQTLLHRSGVLLPTDVKTIGITSADLRGNDQGAGVEHGMGVENNCR